MKNFKKKFAPLFVASALLVIILSACSGVGGGNQVIDPEMFSRDINEYVLRPEYLSGDYHIPSGEESRSANSSLTYDMGEVDAKTYIAATGRVEGWKIRIKRNNSGDAIPAVYESTAEVFSSNEGAAVSISPENFWAYNDLDQLPDQFIDKGCKLGHECLLFFYDDYDPATDLTVHRYDVAFRYYNVVIWVSGRGLDIEMSQEVVLDAAEIVYNKLTTWETQKAE